jgi:hypothetical protein
VAEVLEQTGRALGIDMRELLQDKRKEGA